MTFWCLNPSASMSKTEFHAGLVLSRSGGPVCPKGNRGSSTVMYSVDVISGVKVMQTTGGTQGHGFTCPMISKTTFQ